MLLFPEYLCKARKLTLLCVAHVSTHKIKTVSYSEVIISKLQTTWHHKTQDDKSEITKTSFS